MTNREKWIEKPVLTGNETTVLSVRISHLRAVQRKVQGIQGKLLVQKRIDHIKGIVSNHCSCDFKETIINRVLNL